MSDVLAKICTDKRAHVAREKKRAPLAALEDQAREASKPRGFHRAIKQTLSLGKTALIAEIKKASPSRGVIREDFDPVTLAKAYAEGGATCLSVLTDEPYFQGKNAYLIAARSAVTLPVLRKDFMLDPYQVTESRALGADCILLIMAALTDREANELEATASDWGMDVLVEVHNHKELERALKLRTKLIGINNRDLKTLKVDLKNTENLIPYINASYTPVCESGIESADHIARMKQSGVNTFLVGESLMRETDVVRATRTLLGM